MRWVRKALRVESYIDSTSMSDSDRTVRVGVGVCEGPWRRRQSPGMGGLGGSVRIPVIVVVFVT